MVRRFVPRPLRHHLLLLLLLPAVQAGAAGPLDAEEADLLRRTAETHATDSPEPTPMATTPPRVEVQGREIRISLPDGGTLRAFYAAPAAGPAQAADPAREAVGESARPGVVLIHEWWGLNDNIRDETRRLAGEGYHALAVDLYDGRTADAPPAAMKLSRELSENPDPAEAKLLRAVDWLEKEAGATRVGTIGWCLGGRWSLRAALLMPRQVDATVIFYGSLRAEESELAELEMPVLGIFADKDPIVPREMVENFRATMERLDKDLQVHVYEGTSHGFANPSGGVYDADAAESAWNRVTAFFDRHLRDGEGGQR